MPPLQRLSRNDGTVKRKRLSSGSPSTLKWKTLSSSLIARHDASSSVVVEGTNTLGIVLVGGRSTHESSLADVEFFSWATQRWQLLPSLLTPRCGCAVASIGDRVYVFGGLGPENERLSSCESVAVGGVGTQYNAVEQEMRTPRWYGAAVSLPLHSDIVVLGGRNDKWQELASVEAYDTLAKEWHTLSPMSTPRFGCGAVRIDSSKLLVAGGFNGEKWVKSAEIYCYETDSWTSIQEMPASLEFCTALNIGQHHVLVAGKGRRGTCFYVYNLGLDTWCSVRPGYKLEGSMYATVGFDLIAVDASRVSRMTTNLSSHIQDDNTDSTSRSSSRSSYSNLDNEETTHSALEDDTSPWWATPKTGREKLRIFISQRVLDQVSLLEDDDHRSTVLNDDSSTSTGMLPAECFTTVKTVETTDKSGKKISYTGEVAIDTHLPHGNGVMTWANGDVYTGRFEFGQLHGRGQIQYANGDSFQGTFHKDVRQGHGTYRWKKDGRSYDGKYYEDRPQDENGFMAWKDGTIYIGGFVKGKRKGKGIQRFASGVQYQGDFANNKYHGVGVCHFSDGSTYKGDWEQGKANGRGRLSDAKGKTVYDGLWESDRPAIQA